MCDHGRVVTGLMSTPYTLDISCEQPGKNNWLEVTVKDNAKKNALKIIITIEYHDDKNYKGLGASVEFFENDKRVDDVDSIIRNKGFASLIQYYQKQIIDARSKGQRLLDNKKISHESKGNIKDGITPFVSLARAIFSRSGPRTNRTFLAGFLLVLYLRQGFSVYTSYKSYKQKEITIARTHMGSRNLTLYDRKFGSAFFYLHLANVILANQLIMKSTSDFSSKIEKGLSFMRRRGVYYSLVIAAVQILIAYGMNLNNFLNLVILPLIWPISAFCIRTYGSKVVSIIFRYSINRFLKSFAGIHL